MNPPQDTPPLVTRAHLDEAFEAQGEAYGRHLRDRKRIAEGLKRVAEDEAYAAQSSADYDRAYRRYQLLQVAYEAQARPANGHIVPLLPFVPPDPNTA